MTTTQRIYSSVTNAIEDKYNRDPTNIDGKIFWNAHKIIYIHLHWNVTKRHLTHIYTIIKYCL